MNFDLDEEQRALCEAARGLAARMSPEPAVSWKEAGEYPWEFAKSLAAQGLTGVNLPGHLGGQGGTLFDAVLVLESVAGVAPHLADAVQATNFGAMRQIAAFGSDRVRHEVLAPILAGEGLATVGMSEPGAGSSLGALRTTAAVVGKDVVLNGAKTFNSNGPHATHVVVWARFGPTKDDIGAVVVPVSAAGFSRGQTERFMSGEPFCDLFFDDCRVPVEYVLLDKDGMRRMMPIFNIERIGNATRSLAFGELAFELMTRYMEQRQIGKQQLSDMQGLRWKVADLRIRLDAARLLLYRAASQLVNDLPIPANISIAKCFANETGFEAANQAVQIYGGYGYSSESIVAYLFRRTRGWMIAGGSVEMQRNRVAREIFANPPVRSAG
jgi:alkylation response protein AidB-like acyl-CoA dehydrogenase